jgi:polyisoprenyl-teichoic acid--peptidoglycan teichoic acid transferase
MTDLQRLRRLHQRRPFRLAVLAAVLSMCALVVPNSTVASTDVELVRMGSSVSLDDETIWILAVGSDARPGQAMTSTRADALQMVGLNTRTGAATAIGIPRDSYVSIPGHGSDRVNAAMFYGGAKLLGQTVGDMLGLQPDYVMVTRFRFFEQMIDDIGGIYVNNPRFFSDPYIKPEGFEQGRIRLGGVIALSFARVRKSLPGGDFDRSANQQRVLRGIQARVAERADQPGFMERGAFTVIQHMATDVPPDELFRIAQAVAQVDPKKITGCVVYGGFATIGGASVVTPDLGTARRYADDARKDATIKRC